MDGQTGRWDRTHSRDSNTYGRTKNGAKVVIKLSLNNCLQQFWTRILKFGVMRYEMIICPSQVQELFCQLAEPVEIVGDL